VPKRRTQQLEEEGELSLTPPTLTLMRLLVEVEDITGYIVSNLDAQDLNTSMRLASMKKQFVFWKLNKSSLCGIKQIFFQGSS
jgi:hypothetical protein